MKTILSLILLATACGQQLPADTVSTDTPATEQIKQTKVQDPSNVKATQPQKTSIMLNTKKELVAYACDESSKHSLVYIVEDEKFLSCDGTDWVDVNIKAKDGKNGRDGVDGKDGISIQGPAGKDGVGIQGVQGPQGIQGISVEGPQGIQGLAGSDGVSIQGPAGADGIDAGVITVYQDNVNIGQLYGINGSTNVMDILTTEGKRIQLNAFGGIYSETQFFFYSGADCTGSVRMPYLAYRFANTSFEPISNKWYTRTGSVLTDTWSFASRKQYGGTCQNTAGTTIKSQVATEIQLNASPTIQPIVL
jgi:hypothetical protein